MISTFDMYNNRRREIDLYFDALRQLYAERERLRAQKESIECTFYKDDFFAVLKSNALLMVYNLVESSITNGILEIYERIKVVSFSDLSECIRQIWIDHKFNQAYGKNAHFNTYKNKAVEIINSILTSAPAVMDRTASNISGNLDADYIRELCRRHGISMNLNPSCCGGVKLKDVKEKRNELAHGTISFVECGRDYTLEDLIGIETQTTLFLHDILISMKKFYDEQLYMHNKGDNTSKIANKETII